jgi:ATP adenylyltransferase
LLARRANSRSINNFEVSPVEQLWAPWRLAYAGAAKVEGCFLCRGATGDGSSDREDLVVVRTKLSVVVLNKFPYNNGHVLISPRRHVAHLEDLTADEVLDMHTLSTKLITIIRRAMKAEGFNVGLNLGAVAGAGVPGHLHWHIVPRWAGDTNFMPVLTDVKVIVQSLDALWELLRSEWPTDA